MGWHTFGQDGACCRPGSQPLCDQGSNPGMLRWGSGHCRQPCFWRLRGGRHLSDHHAHKHQSQCQQWGGRGWGRGWEVKGQGGWGKRLVPGTPASIALVNCSTHNSQTSSTAKTGQKVEWFLLLLLLFFNPVHHNCLGERHETSRVLVNSISFFSKCVFWWLGLGVYTR